ncbi:MAG: SpoIIE family protein phosphatase [Flavobacteriales bacterium]|jgi:serine phosphatase RsbU (regulator of sigma subunit)/HAMP domain-containing protein|nr:SpoIIE family protein phosphatase [Flavobacteriales bacterium]MBK9513568.1 SpoIIE family protein phosphatase [Flavobacteriales bacterium]MBP7448469.1 SpoIIE family protein phosphatase [Flavobacteriales bacterium]HOZ40900.1 SpoIIE family protein phosphatase [Flavobacteriales bacterium]
MAFRMTIGRKIGMGFGLFIFFALVVVILTNRTLERSRDINDQINTVYSPSVDALVRLRNLTVNAHTLVKQWALLESIADAPEKTALVELTNKELPRLLDRIDTLMAHWEPEEVARMNRISSEMRTMFDLHERIKIMLPSLESYSDPFIHMERSDLAEEGGPLDQQKAKVLSQLDALLAVQEAKRRELAAGMIFSFDSLKFFVLYMGIALVVVGAIIAFFIIRGIVGPVQRLRSVLLSLGRGVFPRTKVRTTNDEVGDMSKALTSLVEGLRRTTEFSHAVAAGDFAAEYKPLSEEDMLGHALLKMRDELGQRERILEMKVVERTEEVVRQKEEVERQGRKVVELYKNVTDSIRYAKRLQESILPPDKRIRELLPGSFVYYRPKDIVSGDFYWFERVEDKVIFAAVDCTGHGVPGAFMSLIGHNGLNQTVKERGRTRPSEILMDLNRIAYDALHKDREQGLVRDGMDMALCCYDPAKGVLEYAGANNPLYLVRGGEVLIFAPDKNAIGSFDLPTGAFTDHRIKVQEGDVVYIFSDGYADQFGGPKGKKFLYRRFRELLVEISGMPVDQQRAALHDAFSKWRGGHEQVDDILVIGVRV